MACRTIGPLEEEVVVLGVRRFVRATAVGLALTPAACTVGPDYVAPAPPIQDAWSRALAPEGGGDVAALDAWWTQFHDPLLDELVTSALANNRDLRAALWRIEAARAQLGIARGEWFPDVDGTGSYTRLRPSEHALGAPPPAPGSDSIDVDNGNFTTVGLDASWELDVFGRIRRSVESANAALAATVEDERDVRVVLLSDVAALYFEIRTLDRRIALATRNADSQSSTLGLTQRRLDVGMAPSLDVAQAEANLAATRSEIPALTEARERARFQLAVLLGEEPASLRDCSHTEFAPLLAPQVLGVPPPAELLRRRPDIRAAERRVAAQVARIGVAEADLYPRFSLTGSYGYESTDGSKTLTSDSRTFAIGPSFRWNLFDGGRIRNAIAAERAFAEEATALYENVVLRALAESEAALAGVEFERKRMAELETAAAAASRAVDAVRTLYEGGLTDFQNVLDAERTLFQAQDRHAASQGRVAQNLVALYRALGGGWSPPSADVPTPNSTPTADTP